MTFIPLLFFTTLALAKNYVHEGFHVHDPGLKLLKTFNAHPDLTIDHLHHNSYEVYGPKGLGSFLKGLSADFHHLDNFNSGAKSERGYPGPEEIEKKLKSLSIDPICKNIFKLFSIGKSHKNRDLWVMKVSDNPEVDEIEPEFKYIANMHGDEIVGRELMVFLLEDICQQYKANNTIWTDLINHSEIFIMPSMNPDGAAKRRRGNAKFTDLNRDFPDFNTSDNQNILEDREPETKAVMTWQEERNFSLSANFHGGAVVVNYPWDGTHANPPHEQLLIDLSLSYANLVDEMKYSTTFDDGITKGADWYVVNGGMQDWSWHWYGDLQLTVELTDIKWPKYETVRGTYEENKPALLKYLSTLHQGYGIKTKKKEFFNSEVVITKQNSSGSFSSHSSGFLRNGELYQVLEPGTYKFTVDQHTFEKTITSTPFIFEDKYFVID